ncbi:ArsR/SmtB family transcription factor [Paenibacillus sp. y28]|uniref:ArsR/SmtB family transcription factor n=1 Tax=Paenibacillus sp. y28 TaxID=3129110 RepID=UPI003017E21A
MKILYHPGREDIHISSVLSALSDPIRLSMLKTISLEGERPCGEYNLSVSIAKSTLSHHVRILREAGVLRVRVQGTQHLLSIRSEDLEARFPGLLSSILQAVDMKA